MLQGRLKQAQNLARGSEFLSAELHYLEILKEWPDNAEALVAIAELALRRDDVGRAVAHMQQAVQCHPDHVDAAMRTAEILVAADRMADAVGVLAALVQRAPGFYPGWLMLGWLRDAAGDGVGALRAWYQAITLAQRAGLWLGPESTPPHLLELVTTAVDRVRVGRRELFFGAYEPLRCDFGARALGRVDRALAGYLGERDATPADARQKPKFFYFPDLPSVPYLDPFLQDWAGQLAAATGDIRTEALQVWQEDQNFPDFLEFAAGEKKSDYLQGNGARPAWEAFFFYRHGQRFDDNHVRCPVTSQVLESIDLCRVADQAPEICFSVLTPGSHIMPHYGVTNTRLEMHLPLVVPPPTAHFM